MALPIKSHISGKGVNTREKALDLFWRNHRASNGNRRTDPEKFIRVKQVRRTNGGGWDITYIVPPRFRRA